MKSLRLAALPAVLSLALLGAAHGRMLQEPSVAPLEAGLVEARDLAAKDFQAAQERLKSLLDDLRRIRDAGALTPPAVKVYQEALLLEISIQTKLLAPEVEILDSFRQLLVLNPRLEEGAFNPRQKLLLEKVRSAEIGRLSITTSPPDASLYYLGAEFGRTPVELSLPAGTYRFALRKEGYQGQEFEAKVAPAELVAEERTLRRSTVVVPISTSVQGVAVSLNGHAAGTTSEFGAWMQDLPAEVREQMKGIVGSWKADLRSAGFLLLADVRVGEPLTLELQAPCRVPRTLQFSVDESQVDWSRPTVVVPEARMIELARDTGFLQVTSSPAGAEVWLDGEPIGKTPLDADVCAGTHRVQALHPCGQFVQEVVLRRGQASKVAGDLKPALAFLGIYTQPSPGAALGPQPAEWQVLARKLVLGATAFMNLQWLPGEVESMRQKNLLPLEALIGAGSDADAIVKKIAAEAGRVNLVLWGLRVGNRYQLRLHGRLHPQADVIDLPNLDEAQADFIVDQLNRASRALERLRTPHLGLDLLDAPGGMAVLGSPEAAGASIAPGSLIRSVDQARMTVRELQAHLRTRRPGQSAALEVSAAGGAARTVNVPVLFAGAEYPWSVPDSFPNAVMAMLEHMAERDPQSGDARYARLGLALGLMNLKEWKRALEVLNGIDLEAVQNGVNAGTLLYHQGRCYEELGDRANAERCYGRAKDFATATLSTHDGLRIPVLAERRLRTLKN